MQFGCPICRKTLFGLLCKSCDLDWPSPVFVDRAWRAMEYRHLKIPAWERWPFTDQPGAEEVRRRMWRDNSIRDWSWTEKEQAEIEKRYPELVLARGGLIDLPSEGFYGDDQPETESHSRR